MASTFKTAPSSNIITANGIDIAYERYGTPGPTPLILIMGLGGQLAMWPKSLVAQIVAAGNDVILLDNRDVGLSAKFDGQRPPKIVLQVILRLLGLSGGAPYDLGDMAKDVFGLMDHLGLETAHIAGISMGGMIAQIMASSQPERITSLTVMSSTTGNPRLPRPDRSMIKAIARRGPPPANKAEAVAQGVAAFDLIGTPGVDHATSGLAEIMAESYDRCHYPEGRMRQIAAIIESAHFGKRNSAIAAPTLVIHGTADPLVPITGGRDVHKSVPGSKMVEIDGMGHDLPDQFLSEIAGHVNGHIANAASAA